MLCKCCESELTEIEWNRRANMLVCLTEGCRMNQRPQGSVRLGSSTDWGLSLLSWIGVPQGVDSQAYLNSIVEMNKRTGQKWKRRRRPYKRKEDSPPELPSLEIVSANPAQWRDPWFRD